MVVRSRYAQVRGYGSARSGAAEHWRMKLTSYALLPLTLFLIGLVFALAGEEHPTVAATLGRPYVALPLFFFVFINAIHMRLGMSEIIEDYVHSKLWKTAAVTGNIFFSYITAAAAAFALLKLSIGV